MNFRATRKAQKSLGVGEWSPGDLYRITIFVILEPKCCKYPFLGKVRSNWINHFKDMRPTVSESISCRKNVFLLENFKHVFSKWNGLNNGWFHVYKMINLVWTNLRSFIFNHRNFDPNFLLKLDKILNVRSFWMLELEICQLWQ